MEDVLFVSSKVKGAETSIDGGKVSLQRKMADLTGVAAEVTAIGRYQVSILPEVTQFNYFLEVQNPTRAKKTYILSLVNGESVTKVTKMLKVERFNSL